MSLTEPRDDLTAEQKAVRGLALDQLQALGESLKRLLGLTTDQGDREAIEDAQGELASVCRLLSEWYGCRLVDGEGDK